VRTGPQRGEGKAQPPRKRLNRGKRTINQYSRTEAKGVRDVVHGYCEAGQARRGRSGGGATRMIVLENSLY